MGYELKIESKSALEKMKNVHESRSGIGVAIRNLRTAGQFVIIHKMLMWRTDKICAFKQQTVRRRIFDVQFMMKMGIEH